MASRSMGAGRSNASSGFRLLVSVALGQESAWPLLEAAAASSPINCCENSCPIRAMFGVSHHRLKEDVACIGEGGRTQRGERFIGCFFLQVLSSATQVAGGVHTVPSHRGRGAISLLLLHQFGPCCREDRSWLARRRDLGVKPAACSVLP